MLHSKEATESVERFVEKLYNGKIEIDKEPLIGEEVEFTEEYMEQRLQSYKEFLQSDLCKKIMELETPDYMGDNDF